MTTEHGETDNGPDPDQTGAAPDDAWKKVTSDFADLGARVRSFFEERDGDAGAAAQAQESIQELVAAAERAGRKISAAFRDEGVQAQAKSAVTSLIEAIGTSARDLTDRINVARDDSDDA